MMKTNQLRIFQRLWELIPAVRKHGGRLQLEKRKLFLTTIPALLVMIAYTIPLFGCAGTYNHAAEYAITSGKHDRGGRGRGGGNGDGGDGGGD